MKHTTMYKYNNDIELEIDERGILCSMSNYGASCDVVIPRKLPSGEIINAVGRTFLYGEYKIVIISNEITDIAAAAFQSATVEAVVWSAGCKTIPALCFQECRLKKLINTANVTEIGMSAFREANIENIVWPCGCSVIPYECFYRSKLERIDNIKHVADICEKAFANSKLKSLDLSGTAAAFIGKQAFTAIEQGKVVPPYYIPKDVWDLAFAADAK